MSISRPALVPACLPFQKRHEKRQEEIPEKHLGKGVEHLIPVE
jgi:hypothetical protein